MAYLKVTFLVAANSGNSVHGFPCWKAILRRHTLPLTQGNIQSYLQSLGAGRGITFFHTPRRGILKPSVRSCWGGGSRQLFPFCLRTLQLWGHQWTTLSQQDRAIYTRCCQGNRCQQLYVSLGLVWLTCKLLFIKKQTLRNAKNKWWKLDCVPTLSRLKRITSQADTPFL